MIQRSNKLSNFNAAGALVLGLLGTISGAAQTPGGAVLHAFQGGSDGAGPQAGLVLASTGIIYGTTTYGGTGGCTRNTLIGCGTFFELTPPASPGGAWTEKVLYSFSGAADGAYPQTLVQSKSGVFYGTALGGGPGASGGSGSGVLFQLAKNASGVWKESVLYSFCKQTNCADGSSPGNGLVLSGSNLFGTTAYGGSSAYGTVFEFTLGTPGKFSSIYSFRGGVDGANPFYGPTLASKGVLYGVTYDGGSSTSCMSGTGCGVIYQLTPPTMPGNPYTETVIYTLTGGTDGANPSGQASLLAGGVLLCTAGVGGPTGYGTIFELTPPAAPGGAWTYSQLTDFGEPHQVGIPDGSFPTGNLYVAGNGSIYGTTYGGGEPNLSIGFYYPGTIFQLTPPLASGGAWVRSLLYSFQGGSDGLSPEFGLTAGPNGTLIGTTYSGGNGCPAESNLGCGIVFQYTP